MFHASEPHRIITGTYGSDKSFGNNGAFQIDRGRTIFAIIISDGHRWEHVSVHCVSEGKDRTPTWAEMCYIKSIFWDPEDCIVQYHPPEKDYVNTHKHTLHLWRPTEQGMPVPPIILV